MTRPIDQELHNRRRAEWVAVNGPCRRCGSTVDLQVDHVDASLKTMSTTRIWQLALDNPRRISELLNCQVLCGPCHQLKTTEQLEHRHGESHPKAKLTEAAVHDIVLLYEGGGYTHRSLAAMYGVTHGAIGLMLRGKTWRHNGR